MTGPGHETRLIPTLRRQLAKAERDAWHLRGKGLEVVELLKARDRSRRRWRGAFFAAVPLVALAAAALALLRSHGAP